MNKRKLLTRILACMAAVATAASAMPEYVYAEEDIDNVTEEDPEPVKQEEYDYLYSDTDWISFGRVPSGTYTDYEEFQITNYGSDMHQITVATSSEALWDIVIPDKALISSGETLDIYVRPKTEGSSMGIGHYEDDLMIKGFSSDGECVTDTLEVTVSVETYDEPWVDSVTVYPASVALGKGTSYSFSADVEAGAGASEDVTWSVKGANSSATQISDRGILSVGSDESASSFTVTATSIEDTSVSGSATVTVNRSQYTVATQSSPSEGGSTVGGGTYSDGDTATVIANPSNGYYFDGWYDQNNNAVSRSQSYSFSVTGSVTLTAKFIQNSVRITTKKNIDEGGTITDSATVAYGGSYTITATPAKNYNFLGWYEDNLLVSNSTTYTLNGVHANRVLTAVFERSAYTVAVSVSPTKAGKVTGDGSYKVHSKVTLQATPEKGYVFAGWIYNNNLISTDKSFVINDLIQDFSLSAYFQPESVKTYTIGASTDTGNGTITPSGAVKVEAGKSIVFSISPNKDYMIYDVKIDGNSIGAVSSYIFNNTDKDHTIVASFAKIPQNNSSSGTNTNGSTNNNSSGSSSKTGTGGSTSGVVVNNNTERTITNTAPTVDEVYASQASEDEQPVTQLTGTLQDVNMTPDEAREAIETGNDRILMENAMYRGDLEVTVRNGYADVTNETAEESYYDMTSVPNFEEVMDSLLTEDEKMDLFQGSKVRSNLNIVSANKEVSDEDVAAITETAGDSMTVGEYFDVRFIYEVQGVPALVTELKQPMQIVMNVPEPMRADGQSYCVIRRHNGQVDILEDEDDSPNTVTFSTDRMSVFAIASYNGSNEKTIDNQTVSQDTAAADTQTTQKTSTAKKDTNMVIYIMIAVIIMGVGVITGVAIAGGKKRRRRHHRK